ncbi:MAG: probable iron-sulfur binding protein YPO1417 [uncultured Rubrobacteraceae bacterium]|uniref:Probable iron-sulfur binding protein YPO1417 n=1 Tax=uncultured Rubrobacteraceae bacterium TaxID=349277 RepID=A0A6J4RSM9_9ACTN|nr:MAG: probable iron-sulfur binding protein YPO1417 [uncultured Rubrobacteraceae bacterium]
MSAKYHPGEIEVQERAGVRGMAERVGNGIRPVIPPAAREFLKEQPMVVVGSVGADGRVWASLLACEPGFARALDERTVIIDAAPVPGDPLAENLAAGAGATAVGVIAIDLASRRRMRLNGKAERRPDGIRVRAEQVYANCPKYIQAREWEKVAHNPGAGRRNVRRAGTLTDEQRRRISRADTFFVASAHPGHGADASHRGGQPGFVRFLDDDTLEFPDYSGNTMFNTLGNIAANPDAGLLFVDFERGGTLQLAGEAKVVWEPERAARFVGAERMVEFRVDEVDDALPLRWRFAGYSPFNPSLEGRRGEEAT